MISHWGRTTESDRGVTPSSSMASPKWMLGITRWSWPIRSLKRNIGAPFSCWSTARFQFSVSFLFSSDIVSEETAVITRSVSLHSASSYHWEGVACGHWRVPTRQQPHPEVHCPWISHTCTDPVAVDVQRGLSWGLYVSHLSSVMRVCVSACEKWGLLSVYARTCLSVTHSQQAVDLQRSSCFRDVDKNKREDNESELWPDADQRKWFMLLTMSIFRQTWNIQT